MEKQILLRWERVNKGVLSDCYGEIRTPTSNFCGRQKKIKRRQHTELRVVEVLNNTRYSNEV